MQDNHSKPGKSALRGLHYQLPLKVQGKLVCVVWGEVFDVAVDVRKSSATFGKWVRELFLEENKRQMRIPEKFDHGFVILSDRVEFLYKTRDYCPPEYERCIRWNEPEIGRKCPIEDEPKLSAKDRGEHLLQQIEVFAKDRIVE